MGLLAAGKAMLASCEALHMANRPNGGHNDEGNTSDSKNLFMARWPGTCASHAQGSTAEA